MIRVLDYLAVSGDGVAREIGLMLPPTLKTLHLGRGEASVLL